MEKSYHVHKIRDAGEDVVVKIGWGVLERVLVCGIIISVYTGQEQKPLP